MADVPPVFIILTTYKRTSIALKTIEGIKTNLVYDNLGWVLVDDGSLEEEVDQLVKAILPANHLHVYKSPHRGVGHNMNVGLNHVWGLGWNLILMMEDDWYLDKPLDLVPYINTLLNHEEHGMIRFGYMSPGVSAELISEENQLYWKLIKRGFTYNFTGHPSLRHKRFHDVYGNYTEGLAPGATELAMCGAVNNKVGPNILIPVAGGQWGFWGHIGSESLADIEPG